MATGAKATEGDLLDMISAATLEKEALQREARPLLVALLWFVSDGPLSYQLATVVAALGAELETERRRRVATEEHLRAQLVALGVRHCQAAAMPVV
jgi:hypothetical protein